MRLITKQLVDAEDTVIDSEIGQVNLAPETKNMTIERAKSYIRIVARLLIREVMQWRRFSEKKHHLVNLIEHQHLHQ